jgi:hypothetical protein
MHAFSDFQGGPFAPKRRIQYEHALLALRVAHDDRARDDIDRLHERIDLPSQQGRWVTRQGPPAQTQRSKGT